MFVLSPFAYAYVSITEMDKRTDYPGKRDCQTSPGTGGMIIEMKKLYYVIGNEWEGGNLSYHLKDRPRWLYGWN